MSNFFDRIYARIDLTAIRHNLTRVRQNAPNAHIMAVLKADAYGHGIDIVARTLSGHVQGFAVASVEEGVAVRQQDSFTPIIILSAFQDTEELSAINEYSLTPVIHQPEHVDWIMASSKPPVGVWLKCDSGMHRLGLTATQLDIAIEALEQKYSSLNIGLMTHLASADEMHNNQTHCQLKQFQKITTRHRYPTSIGNSAAILAWPNALGDWVRPGIMLYGGSPLTGVSAAAKDLVPVMTLISKLIAIKTLHRGDAIGYGGDWRCPDDMNVGLVACGYGDGYPRSVPSGTPVLIHGHRIPIVGRISMDMLCVDLRSVPAVALGDEVVLWGQGLPVEEIAQAANTICYELLCQVSARVPRKVLG